MRNNAFWDKCTTDSIREAVAEFIDHSPLLQKYKNEKYYELEDAIVNFIEEKKELIYREVDREYQREDVVDKLIEEYGDNAEFALKNLPISFIDKLVDAWQSELDNDGYWEETWSALRTAIIDKHNILEGIDDLDESETVIYTAYLKDWLSSHSFPYECPSCPNEFFDYEMSDENTSEYYMALASALVEDE